MNFSLEEFEEAMPGWSELILQCRRISCSFEDIFQITSALFVGWDNWNEFIEILDLQHWWNSSQLEMAMRKQVLHDRLLQKKHFTTLFYILWKMMKINIRPLRSKRSMKDLKKDFFFY